MKKGLLVSICIPTYNRPDLLKAALESCYKQTYRNFEIIISDNSTDNKTKDFIEEMHDQRINYHKNEKSTDSFSNIIKILTYTKGVYVKYLLDDDLLEPECLERMVFAMEENPTVGVIMAPLKIIDVSGQRIYPTFYLIKRMKHLYKYMNHDGFVSGKTILKDFLTRVYPCCVPSGIMYRKECFEKLGTFNKSFKFINDIEICMRIATEYDFYYIDTYLSSWRYSPSSETIAILHKKGLSPDIFYNLTEYYIKNKKILEMFPKQERHSFIRDSYLFASKRTLLNIIAGIKSKNLKFIFSTLRTIRHRDPYVVNKFKLTFIILYEVLMALTLINMLLFVRRK